MIHRKYAATAAVASLLLIVCQRAAQADPQVAHTRSGTTSSSQMPTVHNTCQRSAIEVPSCGVLWGLYTPPINGNVTAPYRDIERQIGRRFDIVKRYEDWHHGDVFPTAIDRTLSGQGKRILDFSWHATNYHSRKDVSWRSIAHGKWDDTVIKPEARHIKRWHHRVFIDFESEFDNVAQAGRGSAKDYVDAFRHVVTVFRSLHVHNVVWAWVPTGFYLHEHFIKQAWPGSNYVDWVGYDPYNFYLCHGSTDWRGPHETFTGFYHWLQRHNGMRNKPILLGEYAAGPGPKVESWYSHVANALHRLPLIKATLQWSSHTSPICDFRLSDSVPAMAGFASSGLSTYVLGR